MAKKGCDWQRINRRWREVREADQWQYLPWSDPEISRRILQLHLDPAHDQASRPPDLIAAECAFIAGILGDVLGRKARICDLTCGPGLYSLKLAEAGHEVVGVDHGPAAIAYARQQAKKARSAVSFLKQDVRRVSFSDGCFDLVMMIYGQANAFPEAELGRLLAKARRWITLDGLLLLEFATLQELQADLGRNWKILENSIFHDGPHLWLEEKAYLKHKRLQQHQIFILDEAGKQAASHAVNHQSYTPPEIEQLLRASGWRLEALFGDLTGRPFDERRSSWMVTVARPAAGE